MDRYPDFSRPEASSPQPASSPAAPQAPVFQTEQTPVEPQAPVFQTEQTPVVPQTPVAPQAPAAYPSQPPVAPQAPSAYPSQPPVAQQAPYGYPYLPPYGAVQPPMPKKGRGFAVTAMVLGICSICFAGVIGILLAITGLIFAIIALKKCKGPASGRGMAIAGLVCSIVGIIFSVLAILFGLWVASVFQEYAEYGFEPYYDFYF